MPAPRSITSDVVVVGGGPAGLLAALAARRSGREVILIEADSVVGGGTAGHGALWLPATSGDDTADAGVRYLRELYGADDPRHRAFVDGARELAEWLVGAGIPIDPLDEPDCHAELPGGRRSGRVFEPAIVDASVLGDQLNAVGLSDSSVTRAERRRLATATRNPLGLLTALRVFAGRNATKLAGRRPLAGTSALVARLAADLFATDATIWRSTPMLRLGEANGRATVVVRRGGDELEVRVNDRIILASGGFEHDDDLRSRHLPRESSSAWSLGARLNEGIAVRAGEAVGAMLAGMADAEWVPALVRSDGEVLPLESERTLPHSILLDASGERFCDEAAAGFDVAAAMFARSADQVPAVPCFLIMDARHRARYALGDWPPALLPNGAQTDGDIVRSESLMDLAGGLGVSKAGIVSEVALFNREAKKGKDPAFGRGTTVYDLAGGQPAQRPNRTLGRVEKPPYWGVKVYPGDYSTRGGLLTDERSRVVREDGTPIEALYAVGGAAASPWGSQQPGTGAALAAALIGALTAAADAH